MKKILFGINEFTIRGNGQALIDLVNRLSENNKYEVTVFTIYTKNNMEMQLNEKVKVKRLFNVSFDELNNKGKFYTILKLLFERKKVYKKYIENNYDVEIAYSDGAIKKIISTKTKNKNIKKIAWINNITRKSKSYVKNKITRILNRNIYERYDNLIFTSINNLDKFNRLYDDIILPHETVIHNYINVERIISLSNENTNVIFKEDEINFVQVSSLIERKAIARLIDIQTNLIKKGIKSHIYIIGEGHLRNKLEKKIKENKIEDTFTLLGEQQNPFLYIKKADYFCLFSYSEGYPMPIEEAKILKKYILITNTSARDAIIDYKDFSRISENNAEGIEKTIIEAVKNNKQNKTKENNYIYENSKIIEKLNKLIDKEKEDSDENFNINSNI